MAMMGRELKQRLVETWGFSQLPQKRLARNVEAENPRGHSPVGRFYPLLTNVREAHRQTSMILVAEVMRAVVPDTCFLILTLPLNSRIHNIPNVIRLSSCYRLL